MYAIYAFTMYMYVTKAAILTQQSGKNSCLVMVPIYGYRYDKKYTLHVNNIKSRQINLTMYIISAPNLLEAVYLISCIVQISQK